MVWTEAICIAIGACQMRVLLTRYTLMTRNGIGCLHTLSAPDVRPFRPVLDSINDLIDGFESPLGMELLATIDWLTSRLGVSPDVPSIKKALQEWPGGRQPG